MVEKNLPEYDCEWSDTPLPPGFYPKVKLKPIILILKIHHRKFLYLHRNSLNNILLIMRIILSIYIL